MTGRTQPIEAERPLRPAFVVAWLLCALFYLVQFALRSAPSVMVPELATALSLAPKSVGALSGLFYYGFAAAAVPAGICVDRFGARRAVPLGLALVAIGAMMFAAGGLTLAVLGRVLQGLGAAFSFTGAVYLASRGFAPRRLATIVGATQCLGMLGASVGLFVVGPLIRQGMAWHAFWIASAALLAVLGLAMVGVAPDDRGSGAERGSLLAPLRVVLGNPQSWLCGLIAGLLYLPTTVGVMIWGVELLVRGEGMAFAEAAHRAATVPLGWAVGAPLMGWLADRLGRRKPVLVGGAALMLLSAVAALLLPVVAALPPYLPAFLLGLGSGAAMLPFAAIKEVNPDWVKGSATGVMLLLVFALTALGSTLSASILSWLDAHPSLKTPGPPVLIWIVELGLAIALTPLLRETGPYRRSSSS